MGGGNFSITTDEKPLPHEPGRGTCGQGDVPTRRDSNPSPEGRQLPQYPWPSPPTC